MRAIETLRGVAELLLGRLGQWWAEREYRLALAVGGGVLVVLLVTGVVCLWHPADQVWQPTKEAEQPWRYLLVCTECGYRAHALEHPRRSLEVEAGRLQCPQCGEVAAVTYRRGGQSLPPGGWPVREEPGARGTRAGVVAP